MKIEKLRDGSPYYVATYKGISRLGYSHTEAMQRVMAMIRLKEKMRTWQKV